MIRGMRRTISAAVAAGATSMAITRATPTNRKAATAAMATSAMSPVCTAATGTPAAAAMVGSWAVNSSSR